MSQRRLQLTYVYSLSQPISLGMSLPDNLIASTLKRTQFKDNALAIVAGPNNVHQSNLEVCTHNSGPAMTA